MFIAVALLLFASARAQDAAATDKPYASIVARNMFGLQPIPPPAPADPGPPAEPLPIIKPNGIMMLFGKLEVLFKVAGKGKPGQADESYVLAEGERQDEIAVVKINQSAGMITFDNHGTTQELPLVAAANTSTPAANPGRGAAAGAGFNPGLPPGQSPQAAFLRGRGAQNINPGNPQGNSGVPGTAENLGAQNLSGSYQSPSAQPPAKSTIEDQVMSAARDMALIEQNRIATQEAVDKGLLPPLPPTMLTPPDATAADGSPLIVPTEPAPAR